jgi:hypothetical protein
MKTRYFIPLDKHVPYPYRDENRLDFFYSVSHGGSFVYFPSGGKRFLGDYDISKRIGGMSYNIREIDVCEVVLLI